MCHNRSSSWVRSVWRLLVILIWFLHTWRSLYVHQQLDVNTAKGTSICYGFIHIPSHHILRMEKYIEYNCHSRLVSHLQALWSRQRLPMTQIFPSTPVELHANSRYKTCSKSRAIKIIARHGRNVQDVIPPQSQVYTPSDCWSTQSAY
jgi:hypothetical protein